MSGAFEGIPEKHRRYLALSPMGSRAGLVLASCEKRRLSLLVLPKFWQTEGANHQVMRVMPKFEPGTPKLDVIAFEGDALAYHEDDQPLVTELLRHVRVKIGKDGDDDEQGGAPLAESLDARPMKARVPASDSVPSQASFTSSLIGLALLTKRAARVPRDQVAPQEGGGESTFTAGEGTLDESPVLFLLRAWEFLNMVEVRLSSMRKGYVETEEWSANPRGRLSAAGIVRHLETGIPVLHCRFDEFTDITPFFQAIASAMELLTMGAAATGELANTSLAADVSDKAARLRRAIAHVPALPVAKAAAAARSARLGRALRQWGEVRPTCVAILERRPPGPGSGEVPERGSLAWVINTAKLWEDMLGLGLKGLERLKILTWSAGNTSEDGGSKSIGKCLDPWLGLGERTRGEADDDPKNRKYPDLYLHVPANGPKRAGEERWVVDAKYKALSKRSSTTDGRRYLVRPSAADQYQLFAYSHLATIGGNPVTAAAIAFPVAPESIAPDPDAALAVRDARGPFKRNPVAPDNADADVTQPFNLYLWPVRYPSAEAPHDDDSWSEAIDRIACDLGVAIGLATADGDVRAAK